MLFLPRPWERRRESSVLPNQGGKVCSRFCLFPFFIPPFIFTPGCSDGAYLEQPADLPCSHVRCQSRLLPRGSPVTRQAGPAPRPSPAAAAFPGKAGTFLTWSWCAGVLLGELVVWLDPKAWAWGRQNIAAGCVPPGVESCQARGHRSFPLLLPTVQLRPPKMRLLEWGCGREVVYLV